MAEKDYFGPPVVIKKTLVFDQKELYKNIKKAFKDHSYSVAEKNYNEGVRSDDSKVINFVWECKKKASGYVSLMITLEFEALFQEVKVKRDEAEAKGQKGDVTLKFSSYVKKDPESEWELQEKKPFNAFFRELYDKVVKKKQYEDISKTLESDFNSILGEIKLFLKLRRYD